MARIRTATEIEGVAYFDDIAKLPLALDYGKGLAVVDNDLYASNGSEWRSARLSVIVNSEISITSSSSFAKKSPFDMGGIYVSGGIF